MSWSSSGVCRCSNPGADVVDSVPYPFGLNGTGENLSKGREPLDARSTVGTRHSALIDEGPRVASLLRASG